MKASKQRHFNNARTNCSVPQPFGLRNSLKKKKNLMEVFKLQALGVGGQSSGCPSRH